MFNDNHSRHLADKMGTSYLQKVLNQVSLVSIALHFYLHVTKYDLFSLAGGELKHLQLFYLHIGG